MALKGEGSGEVKRYAYRDPRALGDHLIRHLDAMTREKLHSKAAIAAELAWRDKEIERLSLEVIMLRPSFSNQE